MSRSTSQPSAALHRRHRGISRVGTVTGAATVAAAGLTVVVAGGLALSGGPAAASATVTSPGSAPTAAPGRGDARPTRPGDHGAPTSNGSGLLPAQAPPQVQSHGS